MAILTTTLCYPNPANPTFGQFVKRRAEAIHHKIPVCTVAPVPVCPPIRNRSFVERNDPRQVPPIWWPSMYYIPRILKSLDPRFYAEALDKQISSEPRLAECQLMDAHFVWPDGVGAWQVARRRQLPIVCTIRGKLVSQARISNHRKLIAEMLSDADGLIAVSQSLADLAREVAQKQLDIAVIPNGIDSAIYRNLLSRDDDRNAQRTLRAELGWSPDARYVVSIGHLQRLKGFHRLIAALPEIRRRCGDVRLVLVGGSASEPDYERELERLAQDIGSETDGGATLVEFLGRVSPEMVCKLLNAADQFALASESEGWCNAIAESLACGCPVVATDVGGNREQIVTPELGELVPLEDDGALIDAVCAALERDWDRQKIAAHGQQRDWQQVAAQCVDVLSRFI